jgi:hypothetical protein
MLPLLLPYLLSPPQDPTPAGIIVPMEACEQDRSLQSFYVNSSRKLVMKGSVEVDGEAFDIYLPADKSGWSLEPRPERARLLTSFTSTYLAVDQDHDGSISLTESYYAEHPLRIGDSMFEVKSIAADGTLALSPSDAPLSGAVIGRKAPDFSWTTIDGKILHRDDFLGSVLVVDCWAPS